ncbi:transposase [Bradyrhizobium sp. CIR3A]|nr:transposase [Bradyrhizobium sp. CIR3A]
MNVHKNAPLTPKGREAMVRSVVEGGLSQADAAFQFNTTPKTVAKWVKRFRKDGVEGLRDRSSRPHSSPSQTPATTCTAIEALRRQRHTGKQIAAEVEVSPATVSRVLRRLGLNRIRDLEPAEPERRYERETPGEIIHIDIKKLGRFERVGHRITGDSSGQTGAEASAGSSSTSALTTIPASPSRRSNRARRWTARCLFSRRLWLTIEALESPSRAS